ncbi:hypothetical protein CRENBAI_023708, partial [Crenichthys baileyi]
WRGVPASGGKELGCRPSTLPHGTPSQAGLPGPPPKQSHISINTVHCLAKTPSLEPGAPPIDGPGTKAGDRDPRKSKRSRESRKASPSSRYPPDPNPNPSLYPDQKVRSLSRPQTPDGKQQTGV